MAEPCPPPRAQWAPIVYARTAADDIWWRAAPQDRLRDPWLRAIVRAVVSGGRDLATRPRFLLASDGQTVLLGVACRCDRLSRSHADVEGHPTYAFVGWVSATFPGGPDENPTAAALGVPPWPHWEHVWPVWAAAVYEHLVVPDWTRPCGPDLPHPTGYAPLPDQPSPSDPGPAHPPRTAPMPAVEADRAPGARHREIQSAAGAAPPLIIVPGTTQVWPLASAPRLWESASVTATPFTTVIGYPRLVPRRLEGLTHAAAAGLSAVQHLPTASRPAESALPTTAAGTRSGGPAVPPPGPLAKLLRALRGGRGDAAQG